MDIIKWEDRFSVGNSAIDAQHKRLFDILNSIAQNVHTSVQSDSITHLLNQLSSYASYHFTFEQKNMQEIGYPDYLSHLEQHRQYIKKVFQLTNDAINEKQSVTQEMFDFLQTWLLNHVLKSDQQAWEYARQHENQNHLSR